MAVGFRPKYSVAKCCCLKGKPPAPSYESFDGGWWSAYSGSVSRGRIIWGEESNAFAARIIWNGFITFGDGGDFPVPQGATVTSCRIVAREMKAGNEDTSPSGDGRLGSGGPSGAFDPVDFYDPVINAQLNPLTATCHIRCEDVDAPVDYNAGNGWLDLENSPKTTAFEAWTHSYERHGEWAQQPGAREVDSWSHPNGGEVLTPDLSAVLQQVVDRPGWQQDQGVRFYFMHEVASIGIYPPGDIASPFNQYGSWGELRDIQHPLATQPVFPLFLPELRVTWT